jgi:Ca2+:H+ antiporter
MIGLTIPCLALVKIWVSDPLVLGLEPVQIVMLAMVSIVSVLTVVPGRAKTLNGGLHLVLLAAFVFLSVKP